MSAYLLTEKQKRSYAAVAEVRISIWGVVPDALDRLIATGLWGDTRAAVYYRLAMTKLLELENERS